MEQLSDWFVEGRQVGMAVGKLRVRVLARHDRRFEDWARRPLHTIGAGLLNSEGLETEVTPRDFFDWAALVEKHLFAGYTNQ